MTKKILGSLAIASLVATSFVFAQNDMPPPPPTEGRPGLYGKIFGGERGERGEMREERKEMRGEIRENMKEERSEFKEGMKEMRREIGDKMNRGVGEFMRNNPMLNATQTSAIAAKLGITVDVLNAKLASGTKLKEIIKDKIKPEDMKLILPPKMATFTKVIQEGGFFNKMRAQVFGDNKVIIEQNMNTYGEVTLSTSTISVPATPFWKKFFNF